MRAQQAGTVVELRQNLIDCLGSELGSYSRPTLPNIPAIWVLDRPTLPGYRVITSSHDEPLIPAIEVVIRYRPGYKPLDSNFNSKRLNEEYRVYLIFHDSRQSPRLALLSVMAGFETMTEPQLLSASDNNLEQYNFTITNNITLETPRWR